MKRETLDYVLDSESGKNRYTRVGQEMFNRLHQREPALAKTIRGTELDPFYDDSKVPKFIEYLTGLVEESESLGYPRVSEFKFNLAICIFVVAGVSLMQYLSDYAGRIKKDQSSISISHNRNNKSDSINSILPWQRSKVKNWRYKTTNF